MAISRIFQSTALVCGSVILLDPQASHHLITVLRAKVNDIVTIFNGRGGEYTAIVIQINKKQVSVEIKNYIAREAESSLELYLAQGISRGEKMDYTIQKAVELGVKKIIPLLTEHCTVKLNEDRRVKRFQHWQSIIISACEQSGRNYIPELLLPMTLEEGLHSMQADWCFALSPTALSHLKENQVQKHDRVLVLVGPEGGLSEREINLVSQQGFVPISLGPRILRTETAALAIITAMQCSFGDMNA
ncbi:MAG: rsmE [Gammaproteobacteria bacterium]|jgi:16S rRNA (uracil1498-N3)-methyltransferase|nr:rsmE [Gammaproteobacteria bacterium]